jgi:hypothetical protein
VVLTNTLFRCGPEPRTTRKKLYKLYSVTDMVGWDVYLQGDRGRTLARFTESRITKSTATGLLRTTMAGRGESEYVVALHDFVPVNGNTTCLSFRAGQLIHVLNRDSTGWWDGELEGRRGWFPSNYVKASKRKSRVSAPTVALRTNRANGYYRNLCPAKAGAKPRHVRE